MPKIIGSTLADHREMTRVRLLDALSELMSEQTFESITMSQIAQRADVGRTAVYNHFPDKEAILLAYMIRTTSEFAEVLSQALEGEEDPLEQIRIYIRAYLELKERFHLANGVNLRPKISQENAEHLHDHAGIVEHILFHILEGAMAAHLIPQQNSLALVSLIHSSLAGQYMPEDSADREDTIRLVQSFVLHGIGVSTDIEPIPSVSSGAHADPEDPTSPRRDAQAFLRCPINRP